MKTYTRFRRRQAMPNRVRVARANVEGSGIAATATAAAVANVLLGLIRTLSDESKKP